MNKKKLRDVVYYTLLRFLVYISVVLFELFVLSSILHLVGGGNTNITTVVTKITSISIYLGILILLLVVVIAFIKVADILGRRKS